MAYCLFDISGTNVSISDWKVLSLMEEEAPISYCNCVKKSQKSQKTIVENFFVPPVENIPVCGRIAKYKKSAKLYCDKHAKSQTEYRIPEKKAVKKLGLDELVTLAGSLGLLGLPKKKADVLSLVENYLREHSLEPIVAKKGAKAGDTDLIVIGKNMKRIFNESLKDIVIDHVLIENQISTLATRMKTVQGMLAQYFIMLYDRVDIEFVSSANKLKMFSKEAKESKNANDTVLLQDQTQSQKYKTHKKDGVFYCEKVLASGKWPTDLWTTCEKKKKDDLADCFLQGIWWLQKENIITI
jgi:hypothetical protein